MIFHIYLFHTHKEFLVDRKNVFCQIMKRYKKKNFSSITFFKSKYKIFADACKNQNLNFPRLNKQRTKWIVTEYKLNLEYKQICDDDKSICVIFCISLKYKFYPLKLSQYRKITFHIHKIVN